MPVRNVDVIVFSSTLPDVVHLGRVLRYTYISDAWAKVDLYERRRESHRNI